MKAIDFVISKYPQAIAYSSIDNKRRRNSYVILKQGTLFGEIFPNLGATTANKAWTNAKKHILEQSNQQKLNK